MTTNDDADDVWHDDGGDCGGYGGRKHQGVLDVLELVKSCRLVKSLSADVMPIGGVTLQIT